MHDGGLAIAILAEDLVIGFHQQAIDLGQHIVGAVQRLDDFLRILVIADQGTQSAVFAIEPVGQALQIGEAGVECGFGRGQVVDVLYQLFRGGNQ
ncbi:hypothetical protein D3C81_2115050 [compost metagenome]